ncbi:MAG: serine/threonine-protein kinase [Hyalangium sp.]|uniref:serine/threonine-protein kinase n=1 Tax=Hyalangium sp. TaxID=2028555 RepID=UPI00389AD035
METALALHPAQLSPGTVVGRWRVVGWAGRGVHGAVYRAVQVDKEQETPVALKVALRPGDPRMAREAELLSRLRHPSLPRLWDSGEWHHPFGARFPFLAMEWIEGAPLYGWARQPPPSPQQVLTLLAQLASALQAVHAQGAVHRDVKGDNILVRSADSRAVLTDLGMCIYPGAATLTPPAVVVGTPIYCSPEADLFELQCGRSATARYAAGPADDLYALGVTACRLVTGDYPVLAEPRRDERGTWHQDTVVVPPALLRLDPPLRDSILRMLSVRPEDRGTAAHWAQELERSARPTLPKSPPLPAASTVARDSAADIDSRVPARPRRSWRLTAAAGVVLATWAWWAVPSDGVYTPSSGKHESAGVDRPDAGTAGLGETAASAATMDSSEPSFLEAMAKETPPEPEPGQIRPDARGRCPRKQQVALNGGCWAQVPLEREECEATGGSIFKGTCYLPITASKRGPTSSPTNPQNSQPQ